MGSGATEGKRKVPRVWRMTTPFTHTHIERELLTLHAQGITRNKVLHSMRTRFSKEAHLSHWAAAQLTKVLLAVQMEVDRIWHNDVHVTDLLDVMRQAIQQVEPDAVACATQRTGTSQDVPITRRVLFVQYADGKQYIVSVVPMKKTDVILPDAS